MRMISDRFDRRVARRGAALAVLVAASSVALAGCAGAPGGVAGASSAPAAPSASGKPRAARQGVTGQISAENGSTWLLTTKAGKQITVTITPNTQFGTKRQPSSAAQFPVGSEVQVQAARKLDGATIEAARIAEAKPKAAPSASAATPPAPTTR